MREFRPFAAAVSGQAGCDVDRDAGIRPAIAAHKQIEPPALGHADRLSDAAPVTALGQNQPQSGETSLPLADIQAVRYHAGAPRPVDEAHEQLYASLLSPI
ncbi:MAG: hypothetical protein JWO52_3065 [Gammaproteobacteria bacterium]|nr:hypothetical protein [Gammaproteobacteria bacterium]